MNQQFPNAMAALFERDIKKLAEELKLYPDEATIWQIKGDILNSGGNLTLHLIGNLRHFIGAIVGQTGYIRQRDLEFSSKNIPRETLTSELMDVSEMVKNVITAVPESQWLENFPVQKHGETVTMPFMMLHLLAHLEYHLGQVNYHRRLVGRN